MAASPSKSQINVALRRLQKKHPGVEFVVLRASNGEVAILEKDKDAAGCWLPGTPGHIKSLESHSSGCTCRWCDEKRRSNENTTQP